MKKFNPKVLFLLIPFALVILVLIMPKRNTDEEIIHNNEYHSREVYTVYVFGEVNKPGSYFLEEGSTYADLIERCGLTDKSSLDGVNLNIVLLNNASYEVALKDDKAFIDHSNIIPDNPSSGLVDINKATPGELVSLPQIGSSRANAIINYRKNNRFLTKEDILKVEGITKGIYAKIKDFITV